MSSEEVLWLPLDETTSTNAVLREVVMQGRAREAVCWARRQTQGRGRLGRNWLSPEGGLYFSWAVPVGALQPTWLQPLAGLSVLDLLPLDQGIFGLKWPNDILVRSPKQGTRKERKLGGILSEYLPHSVGGPHVIVGIGINLNAQVEISEEDLAKHALPSASLREVIGCDVDVEEMAHSLYASLHRRLQALQTPPLEEAEEALRQAWSAVCWTLGCEVRILRPDGGVLEGKARSIGKDLSLLVEDAEGIEHSIAAGDCKHLRLKSAE